MDLDQVAAAVITALGAVAALVLLITGARGQPRVLGIIGSVFIAVGVVAGFAFQWLAEGYLGQLDTETVIWILAATIVGGGVLMGVGLLLVTRAIVVAGWPLWYHPGRRRDPAERR